MFSIFRKLGWFFKLRWKTYLVGVVALLLTAVFNAIIPLIVGQMTDKIVAGDLTQDYLIRQVGAILLMALIMYALRYGWRTMIFGNSTLLESIMRNRLYDHFTKMDAEFYHQYRTGDLMAHATNDLAALRFVAGGGILSLTDAISQGGMTLFSMLVLVNWKLTLLTIIPLPLLVIGAQYLGKLVNERYSLALDAFSKMNNQVQESVAGIKVIKAFGEEQETAEDFYAATEHVVKTNERVYRADAGYVPMIDTITGVTYVLTIIFGTLFIRSGEMTIGQLVSFFSYLGMMTWPLIATGRLINTLERGDAAYDRVEKILNEESHIEWPLQPLTTPLSGNIDFNVDHFTYPDGDEEELTDVHFHVASGQLIGIAGRTGASKSTIFKLLMREYDHYEGTIAYDGHLIGTYAPETLAENIGYVPQDNFLFSASIRDNIRFGKPNLTDEEVDYYARLAAVHEDIMNFEAGYDTAVGERGVSLSGGQKQRIAIARALALDPEILILDDSLSAVDAKTEAIILKNLAKIREGRTTLIAAHRLSAIMHADKILVLDDGRIIERGQHDELLAKDGWYRWMYEEQQLEAHMAEGSE
ncbi:MAG: ABC transporter transmembrane domain-containing protein [Aerococcus sp.]|nr:ABC transporter transmembrane domain-containing protein [Aerococcus sp.]